MTNWFASYALLPGGLARDVRIVEEDGRFVSVTPDAEPDGAQRLPGIALPGMADCHSHAFHRALRGRSSGGDFWAWRKGMYTLAGRLDPDTYLALATATYAELALAGYTAVGEFHYLHHGPGGRPYDDPNAMGHALVTAAEAAGIRLTLLDTCYLAGGLGADGHLPLNEVQQRFSDGSVEAWAARVADLRPDDGVRIGYAAHSVRAVPKAALATLAQVAGGAPLHVHVSEQPAENEAAQAFYGSSPTALLADIGALTDATTLVHATHVDDRDLALVGGRQATVCLCVTTERDLADGIGPARAVLDAGGRLSIGSDQHVVIDPFEELRGIESGERVTTGRRGVLSLAELQTAATAHASIGWTDAGRIEPGARADLVAVRLDTVRTAGTDPAAALVTASGADVDTVVVDGRTVVRDGRHTLGDVPHLLRTAIEGAWR